MSTLTIAKCAPSTLERAFYFHNSYFKFWKSTTKSVNGQPGCPEKFLIVRSLKKLQLLFTFSTYTKTFRNTKKFQVSNAWLFGKFFWPLSFQLFCRTFQTFCLFILSFHQNILSLKANNVSGPGLGPVPVISGPDDWSRSFLVPMIGP